jgi:predicted phage tail protein
VAVGLRSFHFGVVQFAQELIRHRLLRREMFREKMSEKMTTMNIFKFVAEKWTIDASVERECNSQKK